MSDEEDASDKEHEASQKKLDDAREKGEVPRSTDLITTGAYAGFLLASVTVGGSALLKTGDIAIVLLGQSDRLSGELTHGAGNNLGAIVGSITATLSAFFLFPFVAVTLAIIAQRAMIFTPSKLKPRLNRISPLASLKNKLGRKGLFEFAKSFLKLLVVTILLFRFLTQQADDFLGMIHLSPALSTSALLQQVIHFLTLVTFLSLSIGGLDYLWQHTEHMRSNRMSRKEITDEHRNAEGDPHLKATRRQRGQEIATNRMLSDVKNADVVIVNPTHFAVALQWNRSSGQAPVCVAKGVDEVAARIRERAAEAAVPLHSDPLTARTLYAHLKIGEEVHPDHYRAVAAAIRFAEAMRQKTIAKGWKRECTTEKN